MSAMSNIELNVKLLRAVVKQTALYDRNNENYRKRLASENCWDMVALETGESVEKCKRRWRVLRNDYARWMNVDAARRRAGSNRLPFQYAKDLSFLRQHLNISEDIVDEDEDNESEREVSNESMDRKSMQSLKGDAKPQPMAVDEKKPEKKQDSAPEETNSKSSDFSHIKEDKPVEKEKGKKKKKKPTDLNWDEEEDELNSEDEEAPPTSPISTIGDTRKSTFFIKQTGEENRLIIRKKNLYAASGSRDPLEEEMDDSADESGGTGSESISSRRPRRAVRATGVGGIKQLPVQKAATEQRLTRQQRHRSMGLAAARNSGSPVKLAPVPKYMSNKNQARAQNAEAVNKGFEKAFSLTRDDIFPRPKAPAPATSQSQSHPGKITSRRSSSCTSTIVHAASKLTKRPVNRPANMNTPVSSPTPISQSLVAVIAPPPKSIPGSVSLPFQVAPKATPVSTSTSSSVISNNALLLTSSLPSSVTVTTLAAPSTSVVSITDPVTASPLLSMAGAGVGVGVVTTAVPVPSFMTLRSRTERGMQTESLDIFSDEHFLEIVRPQMAEMNPRQKLHFKKKVFQSLMETFDDATDFPAAGEQQHFNINTPSGFEHVSDREMRLVRELVSLVSAAKHSGAINKPPPLPIVTDTLRTVVRAAAPPSAAAPSSGAVGQPRHLIQRVYKHSNGMSLVASPEEKKIFRIVQTNGKAAIAGVGVGVSVPTEELRKNSVDSNCSGTSVPRAAPAPPVSPRRATAVAIRPQGASSMNTLFGPTQPQVVTTKSGPLIKVREMQRRFSVCGSGGPMMTLGPPPSNMNVIPHNPQQNLSPMEANMLKRRLMGAPLAGMTPLNQRYRYSGTAGPGSGTGQAGAVAAQHANSVLLRRSAGSVPVSQKQPSPIAGASAPQRTPQIASVQGNAFNDFVQPKPSLSGGSSSPLKRSLVVANAKKTVPGKRTAMVDVLADPQDKEEIRAQQAKECTETAATIAADDFSVLDGGMGLKREPQDSMEEDADDILGM
ncbi:uncharacterized protein LOC117580346 [Drosophila guanche]|uniref:Flocculation protein FLO11 n=1 Tax=Drosophila guanche TaxID=7266 RepID=A0A3B0J7H1_DROGU|nr:uncharacterized protein LOC117580346 [Drosophila guanche]SPP76083.1 Hypothetical predicted protein [Drosophila guanche]